MSLTLPPEIKPGNKIKQTKAPQTRENDQFYKLKYMAYCMSQLPPEGAGSNFADFLNYAKFQLCVEKNVLMEDSIWDKYTDEALLVEFFATIFAKSKEKRQEFEQTLKGLSTVDDFNTWADRMIEKNRIELEEKAKEFEDSVNFKPEALGD